jgi:hypothetical protein
VAVISFNYHHQNQNMHKILCSRVLERACSGPI